MQVKLDCERIRPLIDAALDGELDAIGQMTFDDHLATNDAGTIAAGSVSGLGLPAAGIVWNAGRLAALDLNLGKRRIFADFPCHQALFPDQLRGIAHLHQAAAVAALAHPAVCAH